MLCTRMIWISWTNKYYNRKKGWSLETVWKNYLNKVFVLSTAITKLDESSFYYIKMQALFQLCSYSGWDNKTNFSKTKQRWFKFRPNRIFNKSVHLKIVWKKFLAAAKFMGLFGHLDGFANYITINLHNDESRKK